MFSLNFFSTTGHRSHKLKFCNYDQGMVYQTCKIHDLKVKGFCGSALQVYIQWKYIISFKKILLKPSNGLQKL